MAAGLLLLAGLLAACGDDAGDVEAGSSGADAGRETEASTAGDGPAPAAGATEVDACDLLTADDITTVLGPTARRPLDVGGPEPLPPRGAACSWPITSEHGGSTFVQVQRGDELDYEFAQDSATGEVEPRSGLGDEAVFLYAHGNPELWVLVDGTSLGIRYGSFDDDWGTSEDTQVSLLGIALANLG